VGYSKLSVTIPDQTFKQIKELATSKRIKLSHLVAEALSEKVRKMKEEMLLERINAVFEDPDVREEQILMAETIAETTNVEEMPW
jgi:phosphoribosylformylglycinamidine (FGAM) synthase PurS component